MRAPEDRIVRVLARRKRQEGVLLKDVVFDREERGPLAFVA